MIGTEVIVDHGRALDPPAISAYAFAYAKLERHLDHWRRQRDRQGGRSCYGAPGDAAPRFGPSTSRA